MNSSTLHPKPSFNETYQGSAPRTRLTGTLWANEIRCATPGKTSVAIVRSTSSHKYFGPTALPPSLVASVRRDLPGTSKPTARTRLTHTAACVKVADVCHFVFNILPACFPLPWRNNKKCSTLLHRLKAAVWYAGLKIYCTVRGGCNQHILT